MVDNHLIYTGVLKVCMISSLSTTSCWHFTLSHLPIISLLSFSLCFEELTPALVLFFSCLSLFPSFLFLYLYFSFPYSTFALSLEAPCTKEKRSAGLTLFVNSDKSNMHNHSGKNIHDLLHHSNFLFRVTIFKQKYTVHCSLLVYINWYIKHW